MEISPSEYLCTKIHRADQAIMARHEAVLRHHGLTMPQYTVLLTLNRSDGMSGAQLARASGVTQQSMASVLTNLQAKGLIERETSPVHAKVLVATLTDEGRALLDRAYLEVVELEEELYASFTAEERDTLCALIERATEVLARQAR